MVLSHASWCFAAFLTMLRFAGDDHGLAWSQPAEARAPWHAMVGRWLGTMGPSDERVALGFEITAHDDGTLHAAIYSPVLNVYGQDVGPVLVEGQTGRIEAMGATLTRDGDALVASLGSSPDPVRLERVEVLPCELPIPDMPAGPGPLWVRTLGGPIYATPTIDGSLAFIGSTNGVFQALHVVDGTVAWSFFAGRAILGQASVSGGAVYFVCDNGSLFRLDAATGQEQWRYDLGDGREPRMLASSTLLGYDSHAPRPLIEGGVVYVGSGDGSMHAVDAATGQRRWSVALGGRIRGGAACDAERVYVGSTTGTISALDSRTGATVWSVDLRGEITGAPVLGDGLLYVGTRDSSLLVALEPASGERRWRKGMYGSWVESEPVIADATLYIGSSDLRRVAAYDALSGRLLWRTDVLGWSWGTPIVTADSVFIATAGADPYVIRHVPGVLRLDRATGAIRWRWAMPTTPGLLQSGFAGGPAWTGDRIVVAGLDGCVYAFPAD